MYRTHMFSRFTRVFLYGSIQPRAVHPLPNAKYVYLFSAIFSSVFLLLIKPQKITLWAIYLFSSLSFPLSALSACGKCTSRVLFCIVVYCYFVCMCVCVCVCMYVWIGSSKQEVELVFSQCINVLWKRERVVCLNDTVVHIMRGNQFYGTWA